MGVPEGHPFFGNQYTDGGYQPGSFSYTFEPLMEKAIDSVQPIAKKVVEKPVKLHRDSLTHTKNKALKLDKNDKGKGAIIIAGITVVVTGVSFIAYKLSHRKKTQNIKIENVGVCSHCGKPLLNSRFYREDENNGIDAYIQCKFCGEKNYAHYNEIKNLSEE
ncbi:hypothetical protein ACQRC3_00750 [Streptococcus alactolyticus]|uniref:hypothetical protein n=1 Tax=Streptococcus alactolyticus TaxID=29389 RepID=UPI003CFBEDDD